MSASWTVVPNCMQATRNRCPLTPFIARRDRKGQTNCLIEEGTMSGPLWTPEKIHDAQTTLGSVSAWMSSRAGKSFADFSDLRRCATVSPTEFRPRYGTSLEDWQTRFKAPFRIRDSPAASVRKDGADTALAFYDGSRSNGASSGPRHARRLPRCPRPPRAQELGWTPSCQHAGSDRQRAGDCLETARSGPPARPISARKAILERFARIEPKGLIASVPKRPLARAAQDGRLPDSGTVTIDRVTLTWAPIDFNLYTSL